MVEGAARRQDNAMAPSSGAHLKRKLLLLLAPAVHVAAGYQLTPLLFLQFVVSEIIVQTSSSYVVI